MGHAAYVAVPFKATGIDKNLAHRARSLAK
jgi:hypothetical protein